MPRLHPILVSTTLATICGLAVGCSQAPQPDYSQLGLVEISGTVTLDDVPLGQATVLLINEDDQTHSYGVTDHSGRYTLMLNSRKSGVIPGPKRVEISTARIPPGDASGAQQEQAAQERDPDAAPRLRDLEKVPACYNSHSKLHVDIASADSGLDFDLHGDCTTRTAR